MVFIHVKKPRLMQLSKTKDGFIQNPIKREASTCKLYDARVKRLEAEYSRLKRNLNKTGNPNKSE